MKEGRGVGAKPLGAVLDPREAVRVLSILYLVGAVGCFVISISAFASGNHRVGYISGSGTLVFGALIILTRLARTDIAGVVGSILVPALATLSMVTGNGVRDLSVPAFSFNILLANLVLPAQRAWLVTVASCLAVTGVAMAEYLGFYTTPLSFRTEAASVVTVGMMHLALALSARRLVTAFHEGVAKAQAQEQSYRHIFNATSEAILLLDENSRAVIDGNRSAQSMFGFSSQELRCLSLADLMHQSEAENDALKLMSGAGRTEPLLFEWSARRKNGPEYPVEVSIRSATVDNQRVFLAVVRDISERQRLQTKLHESEKLQAVGQLAGGVAHDFNNQLTVILANAAILERKLDDPRLKKCAELIERCSRRSADLTSQLLAFARRGKHQDITVDVFELIGEVVELLKHSIDKRITLSVREYGEELQVRGDPTLLQNALLNLGLNACDAMPNGGRLQFSARRTKRSQDPGRSATDATEQDWAEIIVSDTGSGMDESTLRRAFEPFFTTKQKGSGMGLAAVYGSVESHRGEISISSRPGVGTEFTILLPITDQRRESVTLSILSPTRHFDGVRILLAEDEDDVAETTLLILRDLGCDVVRCCDGQEAVDLYTEDPDQFDAVLLDHMMPRLSGRQALTELRRINPNIRALLTSGYSNQTVVNDEKEVEVFLPKPYSPSQLGIALSRLFDPPQKISPSDELEHSRNG